MKFKKFIKQIFPFIKYRNRVYEGIKKNHLLLKELINFIYFRECSIISEYDLTQEIGIPRNSDLKIERINSRNWDILIKFAEKYSDNEDRNWWDYYYKNKYEGYLALVQGVVVGYNWWADESMKLPPEVYFYNIKLGKGKVFSFNLFLSPKYRRKGNAVEFIDKFFIELKKLGYNRITGYVAADNLPARWFYKSVGCKDVKSLTAHIFFNFIAFQEKAIFVKNCRRHPYYPFAYRTLLSFRNTH